jgi:hypothetical protein
VDETARIYQQAIAMNQQLLLSGVRQLELREAGRNNDQGGPEHRNPESQTEFRRIACLHGSEHLCALDSTCAKRESAGSISFPRY